MSLIASSQPLSHPAPPSTHGGVLSRPTAGPEGETPLPAERDWPHTQGAAGRVPPPYAQVRSRTSARRQRSPSVGGKEKRGCAACCRRLGEQARVKPPAQSELGSARIRWSVSHQNGQRLFVEGDSIIVLPF